MVGPPLRGSAEIRVKMPHRIRKPAPIHEVGGLKFTAYAAKGKSHYDYVSGRVGSEAWDAMMDGAHTLYFVFPPHLRFAGMEEGMCCTSCGASVEYFGDDCIVAVIQQF